MTLGEIHKCFMDDRTFVRKNQIKTILQQKWNLQPTDHATTYKFYSPDMNPNSEPESVHVEDRKGRVYTLEKDMIESLKIVALLILVVVDTINVNKSTKNYYRIINIFF